MMFSSCLLILSAGVVSTLADGQSQFYDYAKDGPYGPSSWDAIEGFSTCGGSFQSPIDLVGADFDPDLTPIDFSEYKDAGMRAKDWQVKLTQSNFKIVVPKGEVISIRSSNRDRADLLQMHFHWGANDATGSEHYIKGQQYPLELHLVHKKVDKNAERSLVVVGVMFMVGPEDNKVLAGILDSINDINNDKTETLPSLLLGDLLPKDTSVFYHYNGSLTTPSCDEIVEWNVLENTLTISSFQLEILRNSILKPVSPLDEEGNTALDLTPANINYRPLQSINGRKILYRPREGAISGNEIAGPPEPEPEPVATTTWKSNPAARISALGSLFYAALLVVVGAVSRY